MAEKIFPVLLVYVTAASFFAFILYGVDKHKAKNGKWRVSEKKLILAAFLGGAPGALLGMLAFRHKTRKLKFKILVPAALFLWLAAIIAAAHAA